MVIEINTRVNSKFNENRIRRIMVKEYIDCVIRIKKRRIENIAKNML
ncbi:hypothetical protein STFE110948_01100 [Streptobacillus felis]|uniref:Uncharacterized protein n=1 Tax=Streptobacillus felis TaxID=1384509 RepID=A0A7Z0PGB4_9FUSO|nr:hypothetical protein [Streptobacillus felis]NYV27735.1 hypothetical protein [Streptobacillus felis]